MKSQNTLLVVLVLLLLSVTTTKAGHFIGADIYYEFVGDSTTDNRYVISLVLYQDGASPFSLPSISTIDLSSSCFANSTAALSLVSTYIGGKPVSSFARCTGSIPWSPVKQWLYQDTITLPGSCANWLFSYSSVTRPPSNGSVFTDNFYVMARLNNVIFQNTTSEFNDPIKVSCVNGAYAEYVSSGIEPDGDSLFYRITPPRSSATTLTTWTTGYAPINPISTLPSDPFSIDPNTGFLTFTPTLAEASLYSIEVSEYRFDSISGWIRVGTMRRDMGLYTLNCNTTITSPGNLFPKDASTASGFTELTFACNSTSIDIVFADSVSCSSIEASGSDFTVFATGTGTNLPLSSVQATNCSNGLTLSATLNFPSPLKTGGDYIIAVKEGLDSNIVLNSCGFEYAVDTIIAKFDSSFYSPVELYETGFLGHTPIINFTCGDSIVRLTVDKDILCASIAADGSDFSVFNTNTSTYIPIKSALGTNCVTGNTTTLELLLDTPLFQMVDYIVAAKTGSDGNTVQSDCAADMDIDEHVILRIDSACSQISLAEEGLSQKINVYPNPTTGSFTIDHDFSTNESLDITITDLLGRTVYSKEGITKMTTINTSLVDGVYMVIIKSSRKGLMSTQKLVIEK